MYEVYVLLHDVQPRFPVNNPWPDAGPLFGPYGAVQMTRHTLNLDYHLSPRKPRPATSVFMLSPNGTYDQLSQTDDGFYYYNNQPWNSLTVLTRQQLNNVPVFPTLTDFDQSLARLPEKASTAPPPLHVVYAIRGGLLDQIELITQDPDTAAAYCDALIRHQLIEEGIAEHGDSARAISYLYDHFTEGSDSFYDVAVYAPEDSQ
jgi:hypothetical protein